MSKVYFCRKVRFHARHRYAIPGASCDENRRRFGASSQSHGHDWELTIWLEGPLAAETGMMVDLTRIDQVLAQDVTGRFHQKEFNEADPFFRDHQPTNEVLAGYFAQRLAPRFEPVRLARLRIAEADDLFAEWHA